MFEHPNVTAGVPVQARQGGRDHGFALARARGGNHGGWDIVVWHVLMFPVV